MSRECHKIAKFMMDNSCQPKSVSFFPGDVNQNFVNASCAALPFYVQNASKKTSPDTAWAFPGIPSAVAPFTNLVHNQIHNPSAMSGLTLKLTPSSDQQPTDLILRNSSSALFQASPAAMPRLPDFNYPRSALQHSDLFISSMDNMQAASMFHRQQQAARSNMDLSRSLLNLGSGVSTNCQFPGNNLPGNLGNADGPRFSLSLPGLPDSSTPINVHTPGSEAMRFLDVGSFNPNVNLSPMGGAMQGNKQQQAAVAQAAFAAAQMNSYLSFLRQETLRMPEVPRGVLTQQGLTPFGFDHRMYQAAVAAAGNAYHAVSTPTKEQTENLSPHYPPRPAGLGLNFMAQPNQILTDNVNQGTQSSEESSNVSSVSPGRESPVHESAGQRSPSTPSDKWLAPRHRSDTTQNHCPHCGKMFSSSSALAKHKLIHSDERKYVCQVCQRGFKRQDHLNGHMITHREKKPFECSHRDCGKSYCDMRSLRRHLESQHGSPLGGATPGSVSTLMSLYPDCGASLSCATDSRLNEGGASASLSVPSEIPRPSSAPSAPELGHEKPLSRRRRSSSVEDSSLSSDFVRSQDTKSFFLSRVSHVHRNRVVSESSADSRESVAAPSASVYEQRHSSLSQSMSLGKDMSSPDDNAKRSESAADAHEKMSAPPSVVYHGTPSKLPSSEFHLSRPGLDKLISSSSSSSSSNSSRSQAQNFSSHAESMSWGARSYQFTPSPSQANMSFLLGLKSPYSYQPSNTSVASQGHYPVSSADSAAWLAGVSSSTLTSSSSSSGRSSVNGNTVIIDNSRRVDAPSKDFENGKGDSCSQQEKGCFFRTPGSEMLNAERGFLKTSSIMTSIGMGMPTNPTAIAVAAAKDLGLNRTPFLSGASNRESFYGIHPSSAKWQNVVQEEHAEPEKGSCAISQCQTSQRGQVKNAPSERGSLPKVEREERDIIAEPFKLSDRIRRAPDSVHRFSRSPSRESRCLELPRAFELSRTFDRTQLQDGDLYGKLPHSTEPALYPEGYSRYDSLPPASDPPPLIGRGQVPSFPPMLGKFKSEMIRIAAEDPSRICGNSPSYENLARSPSSPNKKSRIRPGPLVISPVVSANISFNVSGALSKPSFEMAVKDVYTPPPMLSPRSRFFLPACAPPRSAVPSIPGRLLLSGRRISSLSEPALASSEEHPVVPFPEPKINIGPMFQAELPNLMVRDEAQKDIHRASLMWSPLKDDSQKDDELQSYLEMACSLALYGGSNNREYAFHILQRTRGNIKEAVRLLLSRRHILRADDPNADYHYSGSIRWSSKERLAFRQAYRTKGKLFTIIQQEVATKSVHQCVEFYYLWKAMHPESFRTRTRIVEVESEQEEEDAPPTPTAAVAPLSTIREPVFECNYPDCRARFVSRQALNGHIRVHGGSMAKPDEIRRPKLPKSVIINPGLAEGDDRLPFFGAPPSKKRKAPPTSVIVAPDGTQQLQFQCKVCGRVFNKVKSRSAHMKTHVKKDDPQKPKVLPVIKALELFAHA